MNTIQPQVVQYGDSRWGRYAWSPLALLIMAMAFLWIMRPQVVWFLPGFYRFVQYSAAAVGVMYVMLAGRDRWPLAVVWALGLEACMLMTPYARFLGVEVGWVFLALTISAHAVFGVALGLLLRPGRA